MIQEQIIFIQKFKDYLHSRGFEVLENQKDAEVLASGRAVIFSDIIVRCCFSWVWHERTVNLQLRIGDVVCQSSFPVGLLMSYTGGNQEVCARTIRRVLQEVSDKITQELFIRRYE